MDMTNWLEYFSFGLASQLHEVKQAGKETIEKNLLALQHNLSNRQRLALEYITKHGSITIQEFEKISPKVTRRTLQRELRELVEQNIIETSGATSKLIYKLK